VRVGVKRIRFPLTFILSPAYRQAGAKGEEVGW